jgi:hypothetical protein
LLRKCEKIKQIFFFAKPGKPKKQQKKLSRNLPVKNRKSAKKRAAPNLYEK